MTDNRVLPPAQAFGLAMFAYFMFTVGDSMGKWLQGTYHASQILVTINTVGLIIMLVIAYRNRGADMLQSTKWRLHAIRAITMTFGTILVLYALKNLLLSEFYGLVFMNPIWVALISRVVLKQEIPPSRWAAIFVGFVGVLVIAGSRFDDFNLGVVAAIISSITGACAALMARHIGGHEPFTNFGIATHTAMIAINIPLAVPHLVTPTLPHLGIMLAYGTVLSIAMICITLVFARSHVVSQVAPLQYTQMVWGVLFGWLIFGNVPGANIIAGSALVIGAGLYILRSLHRGRLMNR